MATIAFGIGLDCPNVCRTIHWGPLEDIETFIQEAGRAGQDGLPATAKLFSSVKDGASHVDDKMKDYCKLKEECRRRYLLREIDSSEDEAAALIVACKCCDLCYKVHVNHAKLMFYLDSFYVFNNYYCTIEII